MKKKLLALLLCLALTLSPGTTALAAEPRDTDFFTPREHADLNFEDMTYAPVDVDAALAKMDAVRALLTDPANTDAVRAAFLEVSEDFAMAYTMYSLTSIYSSMDYTDGAAAKNMEEAYQSAVDIEDALLLLARDILASPCAAALDGLVTDEDREELSEYEAMTDAEREAAREELALENEYWTLAGQVYTAEYGDVEWDDDTAYGALYSGDIDAGTYTAITRAIARAENAVLGEHYLKMVALRKRIAVQEGYDDYADYAYENIYDRDYTKEDMQAFHAAVKESIAPIYSDLLSLYYLTPTAEVFYNDYAGDAALDIIEPYIAGLSDELYEAFAYMRGHGLYDSDWSAVKNEEGYTTILPSYGAPFFFNAPAGGPWDLTTAVHEFGHYNNYYWTDGGWYCGSKSIDIAEVHSQALELLFSRFYPEIFGEDWDDVLMYLMLNMTNSIVSGALYDELQQFVYATEDVTLRQINEKYCQLCREYGMIDPEDERTEMYGWVEVPHTFTSPCYYISYAVSAAGAFAFWLDAQEDYFTAVDDYLRFTALDLSYDFQESFAEVGAASPISPAYLAELGETLRETISLDERLEAAMNAASLPFADVAEDDWFYDAVEFTYLMGLFSGTAEDCFSPNVPMTRAMAAAVLYRLDGEEELEAAPGAVYEDIEAGSWYEDAVYWAAETGIGIAGGRSEGLFGPADPITREDLAVMLYNLACSWELGFDGAWAFLPDYPDADRVSDYAWEAMCWMTMNGVINGMGDGTLNPQGLATRAQVAQMLMNFVYAIYTQTAW